MMAFLTCNFFSDVLGVQSSMNVILPQKTEQQIGTKSISSDGKFPVLFLLHGYSDDHSAWVRYTSIERYASEMGLAVVMPAVNKSFYADMRYGDNYWTFISEELPRIASSFFPLSKSRDETYVAGLSMGGYGAFKLALSFPERFSYACSLSGLLDLGAWIKKCFDDPENSDWHSEDVMKVFESYKSFKESDSDLFDLANNLSSSDGLKPYMYQFCGTEDFLYKDNIDFRDHINKLNGFEFKYKEISGTHQWSLWDMEIREFLKILPIAAKLK